MCKPWLAEGDARSTRLTRHVSTWQARTRAAIRGPATKGELQGNFSSSRRQSQAPPPGGRRASLAPEGTGKLAEDSSPRKQPEAARRGSLSMMGGSKNKIAPEAPESSAAPGTKGVPVWSPAPSGTGPPEESQEALFQVRVHARPHWRERAEASVAGLRELLRVLLQVLLSNKSLAKMVDTRGQFAIADENGEMQLVTAWQHVRCQVLARRAPARSTVGGHSLTCCHGVCPPLPATVACSSVLRARAVGRHLGATG